jgi:cytochrome bd-type quinol oxidase subunit 1
VRVLGRRGELVDEPAARVFADQRQRHINHAVPYEVPHMLLAAYLATGVLVAALALGT